MSAPLPPVSLLTPVHRPIPCRLTELHESLDAQAGVDWEWTIQVDGGMSLLRQIPSGIRDDPRVALEANGRWFGQAVTRNLALARVRHPLLQTVDDDDLLFPGAIAAAAGALSAEPALGLAFGRTWRLRLDGRRVPGKNPYAPGSIEPGVLAGDWRRRGGSSPIVVGSVMWRTACIEAQGGWPAAVAGMDVLLLLAVAHRHPARHLDADTYVYRDHGDQIHRKPLRYEMRPHYQALARRMLDARGEPRYRPGADTVPSST